MTTYIGELKSTARGLWGCLCLLAFPSSPDSCSESEHTGIPLSLITHASHQGPELVLFVETPHFEFAMVVSRSVAENGLVKPQWPILLINQPDVVKKACALGRRRAYVIREDSAFADVTALRVDHQEMVPFPVFGVLPAGSIWICHDQGVVFTWIKAIPCNSGGPVLNLGGHQHFASLLTSAPVYLTCHRCCDHLSISCRLKGPDHLLKSTSIVGVSWADNREVTGARYRPVAPTLSDLQTVSLIFEGQFGQILNFWWTVFFFFFQHFEYINSLPSGL